METKDARPSPLAKVSATSVPPAAPTQEVMYSVFDTLAQGSPREHMPAIGITYSLTARTPTLMPRAHALVFLRDPAFRVMDEHGNELKPLPKLDVNHITGGIMLKAGQTVATLDELTDGALAARCASYPGSDEIIRRGDRVLMIRFILDTERNRAIRSAQQRRSEDAEIDELEDMPESQLARVMPSVQRQGPAN